LDEYADRDFISKKIILMNCKGEGSCGGRLERESRRLTSIHINFFQKHAVGPHPKGAIMLIEHQRLERFAVKGHAKHFGEMAFVMFVRAEPDRWNINLRVRSGHRLSIPNIDAGTFRNYCYGMNLFRHPELREGEVLFRNMTALEFAALSWTSKRRGDAAYDGNGMALPFPDWKPVFIQESELETCNLSLKEARRAFG
jgi:hypothetical protein